MNRIPRFLRVTLVSWRFLIAKMERLRKATIIVSHSKSWPQLESLAKNHGVNRNEAMDKKKKRNKWVVLHHLRFTRYCPQGNSRTAWKMNRPLWTFLAHDGQANHLKNTIVVWLTGPLPSLIYSFQKQSCRGCCETSRKFRWPITTKSRHQLLAARI